MPSPAQPMARTVSFVCTSKSLLHMLLPAKPDDLLSRACVRRYQGQRWDGIDSNPCNLLSCKDSRNDHPALPFPLRADAQIVTSAGSDCQVKNWKNCEKSRCRHLRSVKTV